MPGRRNNPSKRPKKRVIRRRRIRGGHNLNPSIRMPAFGGPHGILLRATAIFNTNLSPQTRYNQLESLVRDVEMEQPALQFDAHHVIMAIRGLMRRLAMSFSER